MKRKSYLLVMLLLSMGIVGCGKGSNTSIKNVDTEVSTVDDTQETDKDVGKKEQEVSKKEQKGCGIAVYPTSSEVTEVTMGLTEGVCTVKVPTDYVLAGCYWDAESNDECIVPGLNSARSTVADSIESGALSSETLLSSFSMSSLDNDTMITVSIHTIDLMSFYYYPEAKKLGTEANPAMYYYVELTNGDTPTLAVKLRDGLFLQIVCEGSLEDSLGSDKLAEELYNLVTVLE